MSSAIGKMPAVAVSSPAASGQHILKNSRRENFPGWYREVIDAAKLAEDSIVPGCMVILPLGVEVWNQVKAQFGEMLRRGKCSHDYQFPLFIPSSLFAQEAEHVAGFAKECAVVTHHRMMVDGSGKMVPDPTAKLDEPLIVRPTSETIIGESFRGWIRSKKDLPRLVNQWCNVIRMERATRPFLRTTEFFWQEGHCAFATEPEGRANALKMAQAYETFMTQVCALPVILGEKSPGERFAGAVQTFTLEAMMQDGKAVQSGTSHYLGDNFARASHIQFTDGDGEKKYAHTTSWGISTRLIGSMIMTHSDDNGLRLPPRIAPVHVVIIPSGSGAKADKKAIRDAYIPRVEALFAGQRFEDREISIELDDRDEKELNAGEKGWDALKKGTPIRIEIGPREAQRETVTISRRDKDLSEKVEVPITDIASYVIFALGEIQQTYFRQALAYREALTRTDILTPEAMRAYFADPANIGFVRGKWCGDKSTEETFKDLSVTIRCLPLDQSGTNGICILTGRPATIDAIFGRSY